MCIARGNDAHQAHLADLPPRQRSDRAKAFYADTLGFELLADNEFAPGQRLVQLAAGKDSTTITLTTWFDDYPPGTVRETILEVDDLAWAKAELGRLGPTFTGPDQNTSYGKFPSFSDPDGSRWSLHEPPSA